MRTIIGGDLFNAIKKGITRSVTLKAQIMPYADAVKTYRFNPFLTSPRSGQSIARLSFDRCGQIDTGIWCNVIDFHTEIEQAAFEPNNLVPGIGLSPDKMLLARGFAYSDAHRARLGVNS